MSGIESYPLRLEPELVCEADDLTLCWMSMRW